MIYRDGKKIRIGSCKQCGKCCSHGIMLLEEKANIPIHYLRIDESRICGGYDPRTKRCKSHDDGKPQICKEYPQNENCIPNFLKNACGYKFIDRYNP